MNTKKLLLLAALVLGLTGCGQEAADRTVEETDTTVDSTVYLPLYISTMTHMEGAFKDDQVEKIFQKHVDDLRWAIELFDEYGAKLTIESGQSFAKANANWDLNFLQEVLDRGHGVGTHMDTGLSETSLAQLTANFKESKKLVDDLVGAENNLGMSAGTSTQDWVLASLDAGFKYMDAVTALGYLSMDESLRPEGWDDQYIKKTVYHDPIPVNFAERIYPRVLNDAQDFESDGEGLVILLGDIGELASLAEDRKTCGTDCSLDEADVQAFLDAIEEAEAVRDPSKFARINVHIPAKLLVKENEALLRELLSGIQEYTDAGTAKWATQLQAYEAYESSL